MKPLISVIVPVYNTAKYLDRCINSIINQTYSNIEIILVDDGSTDESPQICEDFAKKDPRIRVIHKINGGSSSARNAGLDDCKGEYVGFVDSDDWITETMYEELLNVIDNPEMIATTKMYYVQDEIVSYEYKSNPEIISEEKFLRSILLKKEDCSVCSKLFPRNVIEGQRFDENRLNEDILYLVYLIGKFKTIAYTGSAGYYYYQREGSISHQFGKAIHDMIYNSSTIRKYIEIEYPNFRREAEMFELFQFMSFLLACPYKYNRKSDDTYIYSLNYVRKNVYKGLKNPFFSIKDKIKLLGLVFFPKLMSKIVETKANNR